MKLIPFLILALSLLACSKDHDSDSTPTAVDTLNTGWTKLELPTTERVLDIFFINNSTGYALAGGGIFRSVDGGSNWQKVYQSGKRLQNIGMGSVNNAIFTSEDNTVFRTIDGGNSFDSVGLAGQQIHDVFFVNTSIAYAVGQKTWKTTNAGSTWNNLSSFNPNGFANLKSLYFLTEQAGWVTGNGLFKTTNGGVTWDPIPGASGPDLGGEGSIYFTDANAGFVTDLSSIYKTTDGGTTGFNKIFTTRSAYHDIHFTNSQTGFITDNNYIFKTADAGQTWNREVFVAGEDLIELHFTDPSHGWAGGSNGLILVFKQ